MEENKKKNNLILRIFAFTLSLTLMLSIGVFSLNSKVDKVEASSTPNAIQQSQYNIGLGNWFQLYMTYNWSEPYLITNSYSEPMLHIQKPVSTTNIETLDYCNLSLTCPTLVTLEDGSQYVQDTTYNLTTAHNSQRYRFLLNNVRIPCVSMAYTDDDNSIANITKFGTIHIRNVEINIPIKYVLASNLFNNALTCRYLYYKTAEDESKLNIVFARENGTYQSDPVISVYLTFDGEYVDAINGRYMYDNSVLRIDRSEYIRYIDRVVEKPVYQFTPLNAIKDGVNSFLGIKVLPNFSIGNFLALALGISFFGFLLHLIIK